MDKPDLGDVIHQRRRAGRFGAFVSVALALICGLLPALLVLSNPGSNPNPREVAAAFLLAGAFFLLLAFRLVTTGLWFHERGVRRRGVLTSSRHPYSAISGVEVEEFRTRINGADAGHSVILRYSALGRKHRLALTGNDRDPDADAIIALMRGSQVEGDPRRRAS